MSRRGPANQTIVAELVAAGRGTAARPAFEAGGEVLLSRRSRGEASIGDLVTLSVRGGAPRVLAIHGRARSARAALRALLADEGLGRPFPAAALAEAEEAAELRPADDQDRHDLRDQRVITIDPDGAKDHDDGVAAEREGELIRLWVHIADVARHVPAGGSIDREAARRGTSVYVPGTVDPMLPPRLSSDLCSLLPGVDRAAVTAELLVAPDGELASSRFYRSMIRSDRRLSYPEVDAHFAGVDLGGPALEADIALAREAARRLHARRARRGALEIASAEPVVRLDGDRVAGVHLEEQTESHSLIEECMVAANEAVARYLIARSAPTIFRYHEDPAEVSVERLYDQLDALGVATPPLGDGPLAPADRAAAARLAAVAVAQHVRRTGRGRLALPTLVLRSLRQAYYAPDRVGHSGLASAAYLHFTSPIRRYPDLLAHRALLDALGVGEPGPDPSWLADAAEHSSTAERAAADVERRADRLCTAYLLADELVGAGADTVFAGEVTGLIEIGAFVRFGTAYEGFLPVRRIAGDHFTLDPLGTALVGESTGRRIRLGDPVSVRVLRIEALRGRVDLEPAEAAERAEPALRRDRARRHGR